ncbi:MAG: RNA polymerase sigma factor [Parvularculaceae bacterium]
MSTDDSFPSPSPTPARSLSLETLYRSYRAPLASFLRKRAPEEAVVADIIQTVFARLANGGSAQSIRDARQYLFRAARNQLASYYRSNRRDCESAETYAADPTVFDAEPPPSPEQEAIRRDKLQHLRAIIDAMPEKRRTAFVLARFQEWTDTEIAAHMGLSPAAVRQHVSRAMQDCRVEMRRIFGDAASGDDDAR